jgi:protein phosphatase
MEVAARKGASSQMGTTLTLAYLRWPDVYIAHVGDSRCYVLRAGQLVQLTRDHTLAQQMRERGGGDNLSHFDHVLVNAVGGSRERPEVEGQRIRLANGDRLLLCSDGLSGELTSAVIASLLGSARSPGEACHRLVSAALDAGGRDNVTTIVAFF